MEMNSSVNFEICEFSKESKKKKIKGKGYKNINYSDKNQIFKKCSFLFEN